MAEIPTAEELLIEEIKKFSSPLTSESLQLLVNNVATEFAKLHVEAALKEASEKAKASLGKDWIRTEETIHPGQLVDTIIIKVDKDSILNSYPLTNIK